MHEIATTPGHYSCFSAAKAVCLLLGGLVLALIGFAPAPASAQVFPYFYGPSWAQQQAARRRAYQRRHYYQRRQYQRRQAVRPRTRAPKASPAWYPDKSEKDPVTLIVSLKSQKVTVFQGDKALVTSRVSSGKSGHATPTGVFSILGKSRWHRSNIYSGAPMPYMQRLTWSGIALHASNSVPGYPASHGCVRMPNGFAPQLFYFTKTGYHVVITNKTDLAPKDIVHEKLFQPAYPAQKDYDVVEAERVLAASGVRTESSEERSSEPVRILVTMRTGSERLMDVQRMLNGLQFSAGDVDGWMGPDTAKAIRRFQETYADAYGLTNDGLVTDDLIHALYKVSGKPEPKNGHIYVRQDFKQLFDAPVEILDPQVPLGDHLITAQHFEPGGKDIRWQYLSMNKKARPRQEAAAGRDPKTASDQPEIQTPVPMPISTVAEALDRISIPDEMRQKIAEILTPGSSIAISDDGLSNETHPKGTDFVLLTND